MAGQNRNVQRERMDTHFSMGYQGQNQRELSQKPSARPLWIQHENYLSNIPSASLGWCLYPALCCCCLRMHLCKSPTEKELITVPQFPPGVLKAAENFQQAGNRGALHIEPKQDTNLSHNAGSLPSSSPCAFLCQQAALSLAC